MSESTHQNRSMARRLRDASPLRRMLAAALILTLVFASIAPAFAQAREPESEGEGSGPPGPIVGIEEPGFEPGGEETPLEEVAPMPGEEGEEVMPPEVEPPVVPRSIPAARSAAARRSRRIPMHPNRPSLYPHRRVRCRPMKPKAGRGMNREASHPPEHPNQPRGWSETPR